MVEPRMLLCEPYFYSLLSGVCRQLVLARIVLTAALANGILCVVTAPGFLPRCEGLVVPASRDAPLC